MFPKPAPCSEADVEFLWEKYDEEPDLSAPPDISAEEERLAFRIDDDEGRIIGGCVLGIDTLRTAEFERLWVDERYRRQGMASALIREAERTAYEKGCRTAVNAFNFDFQPARPLFEKFGYTLCGVSKDWPRGHECYTLIKRLERPTNGPVPEELSDETRFATAAGSEEDGKYIADRLEEYNSAFAPRVHPYLDLDIKLTDEAGGIIAGCIAGVSGWNCAHTDLIWVSKAYRSRGVGSFLIAETEREAREKGAYIARLDTPASAAPFFINHGYEITAVYENEPKWYVMQKRL